MVKSICTKIMIWLICYGTHTYGRVYDLHTIYWVLDLWGLGNHWTILHKPFVHTKVLILIDCRPSHAHELSAPSFKRIIDRCFIFGILINFVWNNVMVICIQLESKYSFVAEQRLSGENNYSDVHSHLRTRRLLFWKSNCIKYNEVDLVSWS